MKQECSLVLELCRFCKPDQEEIQLLLEQTLDYPFVLGHLLYNRMGAVACRTLRNCNLPGNINREFASVLNTQYEADVKKAESFASAVDLIIQVLEQADFPYALLKGVYLHTIYPKGLRTSNDVDILVEPKHITSLSRLLTAYGWRQGTIRNGVFYPAARLDIIHSRMNRGETIPFIKEVRLPGLPYCEVDINFSLYSTANQSTEPVSKMLEKRQRLIKDSAYTLCPEDFLIHLCMHLYKEATVINWVDMGRDLSLYKFCDIYVLTGLWMDAVFAKNVRDRVCTYGLEKECFYALYYARELFQINDRFYDWLLDAIRPPQTAYLKEIVNVSGRKRFYYDKGFIEWFFCGNRKEHLKEITEEAGGSHHV
ncbi:MAG: nucleotidyltransferase family protein [Lachnospiraceae bacterium]|nr:nucleotidyltransferase family protein [Lachnospiraceae bacterium]